MKPVILRRFVFPRWEPLDVGLNGGQCSQRMRFCELCDATRRFGRLQGIEILPCSALMSVFGVDEDAHSQR